MPSFNIHSLASLRRCWHCGIKSICCKLLIYLTKGDDDINEKLLSNRTSSEQERLRGSSEALAADTIVWKLRLRDILIKAGSFQNWRESLFYLFYYFRPCYHRNRCSPSTDTPSILKMDNFCSVSHKVTVTSVVAGIALLLLGVLCHGDGMSTTPLWTKALGAESIHKVFFSYEVSMTTKRNGLPLEQGEKWVSGLLYRGWCTIWDERIHSVAQEDGNTVRCWLRGRASFADLIVKSLNSKQLRKRNTRIQWGIFQHAGDESSTHRALFKMSSRNYIVL